MVSAFCSVRELERASEKLQPDCSIELGTNTTETKLHMATTSFCKQAELYNDRPQRWAAHRWQKLHMVVDKGQFSYGPNFSF